MASMLLGLAAAMLIVFVGRTVTVFSTAGGAGGSYWFRNCLQ
jgi:hypothetical protein